MICKHTNRFARKVAFALAMLMTFQALLPTQALALTSGPSQPEFNSFEPVGTTQMVDPFTGSFVYNIPLFELPGPDGGYPFNLSYKPDGNINSEAGPFGYGWTINPGIISRDVRGIADDANGESIIETNSIKDNWTAGLDVSSDIVELFGLSPFNAGFGVYYNSYRGVGVQASLGLSTSLGDTESKVGVGLSLDSQEGFNVSPSINIGGIFNASTSYNARRGMSGLSLSVSPKIDMDKLGVDEQGYRIPKTFSPGAHRTYGTTISFAGNNHSPSLSLPYNSFDISGKVKLGGSFFGVFTNVGIGGSFKRQALQDKGQPRARNSFGYLNMEHALGNEHAMLDFSREKDGVINENSPNLGLAMSTPDVYMATGQGMAGMFRPYRSDIGIVYDPKVVSDGGGGSFSFDAFALHAGGSGSGSFNISTSGKWDNEILNTNKFVTIDGSEGADFIADNGQATYEPYYFKTQGEKVAEPQSAITDYVGGEGPIRPDLDLLGASGKYIDKNKVIYDVGEPDLMDPGNNPDILNQRAERKPRGLVIQDFKNNLIDDISLFKSHVLTGLYSSEPNPVVPDTMSFQHDATHHAPDHMGGFVSTDVKGVRYVYGIPAYNMVKEQHTFSVAPNSAQCDPLVDVVAGNNNEVNYDISDTEKFYKKIETPAFAHSYLLTSVLGSDYIDVTNDGPTPDDIGYWVKFSYTQVYDDYSWRSPYQRAFYDRGIKVKGSDDKGSFTYGEKEIWMLSKAESKTHVAVFETSLREDAIEAAGRFANTDDIGTNALFQVDRIKLFTRAAWDNDAWTDADQLPLRTIHFDYGYTISGEVPNSSSVNQSKLTLTGVWFTSENSTRGQNNKYKFNYGVTDVVANNPSSAHFNPEYTPIGFDRWGTFQTSNNTICGNIDFPYTKQIPEDGTDQSVFYDDLKSRSAVWNLKAVTLPSGSKIRVDWEPHSYGFVQNQEVTEMVKIHSLADGAISETLPLGDPDAQNPSGIDRIYFKSEIDPMTDDYYLAASYFDNLQEPNPLTPGKKQLYIKSRVKLFPLDLEPSYQEVAGYVNVVTYGETTEEGICWVDIERFTTPDDGLINYHPISIMAWQFMKQQLSERLLTLPSMPATASESGGEGVVKKLVGSIENIINFFSGFYASCQSKGFAKAIDLDHSYMKLCSPGGEKFGGGARVSQITLVDSWEANSTYGQKYEYFDGVATNEPGIGSDENALKYAKTYPRNLTLATDEINFFEYPINENLYPGPAIGYGRVEVKSLATHLDETNSDPATRPTWLPFGISTTGKVVHEFYTAKEFPVITDETAIDNRGYKANLTVFPFGSLSFETLTASQGYSIIKNDMHGKPKMVSNYAQAGDGTFLTDPYNWVKYNYKHDVKLHNGKEIKTLNNVANVLLDYDPESHPENSSIFNMPQGPRLIGVDYEMINDMRRNHSLSTSVTVQTNVDFIIIPFFPPIGPIPIPTVWASGSIGDVLTRTASTNKMIFKSGILESVEAFDGGSSVITENLLFDPYTGNALLTSLENEYGAPIYNLNVPGYMVYDNMGPVYENINLHENGLITPGTIANIFQLNLNDVDADVNLDRSSVIEISNEGINVGLGYVQHVNQTGTNLEITFYSESTINQGDYDIEVIVSDRLNNLSSSFLSLQALENPTINVQKTPKTADVDLLQTPGSHVPHPFLASVLSLLESLIANGDLTGQLVDLTLPEYAPQVSILNSNDCFANYPGATSDYSPNHYSYFNILSATQDVGNAIANMLYTVNNGTGFWDNANHLNAHTLEYSHFEIINNVPTAIIEAFDASGASLFTFQIQEFWKGIFPVGDCTLPAMLESNGEPYTTNATMTEDQYVIDGVINQEMATYATNIQNGTHLISESPYLIYNNRVGLNDQQGFITEREISNFSDVMALVDLRNDGIFNSFPLINPLDPKDFLVEDKFVQIQQSTRMQGGKSVESQDAIGNFSSALLGYNGDLTIATAVNANQYYIEMESFEELPLGLIDDEIVYTSGKISFYPSDQLEYMDQGITYGKGKSIYMNNADRIYCNTYNPLVVKGVFEDGRQFCSEAILKDCNSLSSTADDEIACNIELTAAFEVPGISYSTTSNDFWTGNLFIKDTRQSDGIEMLSGEAYIINELSQGGTKAHTGRNCLKISEGGEAKIKIAKSPVCGRTKYRVTAWIKRDQMQAGSIINSLYLESSSGYQSLFTAISPIIDGWIQVEYIGGHYNNEGHDLTLKANPVEIYNSTGNVSTINSPLYVDDIRVQPINSSMVTYVYDPDNYRLLATLDENNFATFYEYDHEGRLTTVKKETERGIKTIQYNQSHLATIPNYPNQ